MSASDFFNRWSRRKSEAVQQVSPAPTETRASEPPADTPATQILPTLADVDKLTPDSDYSAFVAGGVDEDVKRSALKKLFSDPHFNKMDGLDTYIDDYTRPDPIPPAVLAALNHAKALLDPAVTSADPGKTLMALLDDKPAAEPQSQEPLAASGGDDRHDDQRHDDQQHDDRQHDGGASAATALPPTDDPHDD